MALLFVDSFDHYATADITTKWTSTSSSGHTRSISSSAGRRSSSGFRLSYTQTAQYNYLSKTLTTSGDGFVVGCYVTISSLPGPFGAFLFGIYDAGTLHLSLRLNSDFTISVLRGSGTVLGTSGVTGLSAGVGGYIEWKGTISDTASAGSLVVRVNNTAVYTSVGTLDTKNTANATWNAFGIGQLVDGGGSNVFTGTGTLDFDDLYVLDQSGSSSNDFLGDCRIDALIPSGAGTTTQFTPSASTNVSNIDDATPDGISTYNSSATVGHIDTFAIPNAPVVGGTVLGVQHCIYAEKGDAGTCTIGAVVRHSGTDYIATAQGPSTAFGYLLFPQDQNPGTAAAWTESGFNAIEAGYSKVS
jgi:hypothetical protein